MVLVNIGQYTIVHLMSSLELYLKKSGHPTAVVLYGRLLRLAQNLTCSRALMASTHAMKGGSEAERRHDKNVDSHLSSKVLFIVLDLPRVGPPSYFDRGWSLNAQ